MLPDLFVDICTTLRMEHLRIANACVLVSFSPVLLVLVFVRIINRTLTAGLLNNASKIFSPPLTTWDQYDFNQKAVLSCN
jgi:hypothetical protein